MGPLSKYTIQFAGLSQGKYQYEYHIDETFFKEFKSEEAIKGNITVMIDLNRQENMLLLHFQFKGYLEEICDLCLEKFQLPVDAVKDLIIKISDHFEEEDEDVFIIPRNEHQVNVAQHIYDYINLAIPIKKVHPADAKGENTCNPEAIKRLNNYLINDKEIPHQHDSRWDVLKNLNLNREN